MNDNKNDSYRLFAYAFVSLILMVAILAINEALK
jgi:hypothetical protein